MGYYKNSNHTEFTAFHYKSIYMSIFQQLSEAKLTEEEIKEVVEMCDYAVKIYNENLQELNKIIQVAREAEDENTEAIIKVTLDSNGKLESSDKTLDELIAYRDAIIEDNKNTMDLIDSAAKKLRLITKIFD